MKIQAHAHLISSLTMPGAELTVAQASSAEPFGAVVDVTEAFRQAEAMAVNLGSHLRLARESVERYEQIGGQLKLQFTREVAATSTLPNGDQARAAAIEALRAGLMCGALDGLIIHIADRLPTEPRLDTPAAALQPRVDLLTAALAKARGVSHTEWRTMDPDDLHLLSGFGKHENRRTADEAEALVARPQVGLLDYQSWLLATFKAGYAIGLVDATIVGRTGERPGSVSQRSD